MREADLKAALYLEAVLAALPVLAAHDPELAATLAGPDVAVALSTPGLCARLAVQNGRATTGPARQSGDLRLWFPTTAQLVRAFDGQGRAAFALPLGGWRHFPAARRLTLTGQKLETLLNDRAAAQSDPERLRLHVWANLTVGVAAASAWLKHHPEGPAWRARLGDGLMTFSCPGLPTALWIEPATGSWGAGPAPRPAVVEIHFTTLAVALAELDHRLDTLAALGLGDLRITGKLPLAEVLGEVMLRAGELLQGGEEG